MKNLVRWFTQQWRRGRWSAPMVALDPTADLGPALSIRVGGIGTGRIRVGPRAKLERGVMLDAFGGSIAIGCDTFVGPYTVVYGHGGVEIGDACLIAMHCRILSSEHTVPALDRRIRWEPDIIKPTRLGDDVWLGAGVTVLGGVTIGDGCVVGSGAVVTSDLPPGSIAVGIPAQVIRHRPPPLSR